MVVSEGSVRHLNFGRFLVVKDLESQVGLASFLQSSVQADVNLLRFVDTFIGVPSALLFVVRNTAIFLGRRALAIAIDRPTGAGTASGGLFSETTGMGYWSIRHRDCKITRLSVIQPKTARDL